MHTYDAPLATEEQLGRAHSSLYVRELFAPRADRGLLSRRSRHQHEPLDAEGRLARSRGRGASHRPGPLGEVPTAFCSVRPPGHHAEHAAGMGFCFFNNTAVGIRHALDVHGLSRVALIDFDVHHGNGSEDIFKGDERVLMCSIFEKGLYPFNGEEAKGPQHGQRGPARRSGSDKFREAVTEHWMPALDAFAPGADLHLGRFRRPPRR
jgi:acetoin utilization deacetylase AcuC-like enzyme